MRHCVEGSYLKLRSLKPVKANLCQNDAGIFRIIARIPLPATEFSSVTNRHTNCATIKHERTNKQTNVITKFRSVPPSTLNEQPIVYMKAVGYEKG